MNIFAGSRLSWGRPIFLTMLLSLLAALLVVVPVRAAAGVTEIVFASGPDESGTVQRLVDAFNELHRDTIHVKWRQMPRVNDAHRRELVEEFTSAKSGIDLVASDVIWTAEFARNHWVEDLTGRFYDAYDRDSLVAPALGSATYRLRVWGVPWYTDVGLLFYRKDKLARSGFTAPPETWAELSRMSRKVMDESATPYGFVFQGAAYEGGTANAAEFIWNAGGELINAQLTITGSVVNAVTETDAVAIGSDAATRGFAIAQQLVTDKIVPAAVTSFRERESLDAFIAGNAVFLRSWPYVYSALRQAGFTPEQFGVAPLPVASAGDPSASCLGGWNLMISAGSSEARRAAAWQLIRFLTAPAQQQQQAREAGLLPILTGLYEDADLIRDVPLIGVGKRILKSQLQTRPKSPFYSEMSNSIASAFNQTLKGEISAAEATRMLDQELRVIVARNR